MKIIKALSVVLAFAILSTLTACGEESADIIFDEDAAEGEAIMKKLNNMTLREKVGQLFIVRPDSLDFTLTQEQIDDSEGAGVTELSLEMAGNYREYPAGGIIMFSKNIDTPEQITSFIASLQSESKLPLFIGTDEEGGIVSRLASNPAFGLPRYTSAGDVGRSGKAEDAYDMGNTIGNYLHEYGFNMDFAPVADVNTNPDNPIIGKRAFSSDPNIAAKMAHSMAEALKANGIIPVYKHFPGHGNTSEDSHSRLAVSYKTESELLNCEFIPFMEAGKYDCIMIGHIALPNVVNDAAPASMSEYILQNILKEKLGFEGLVISDSLAMKAVTNSYAPEAAALTALKAGCDIVLMPNEYAKSFDSVVEAVENGDFSEELLNEKVYKVLSFKAKYLS